MKRIGERGRWLIFVPCKVRDAEKNVTVTKPKKGFPATDAMGSHL